jgi:hypothetical protein
LTRARAEKLLKRHGYDDGGPVSDRPPVTDYPTRDLQGRMLGNPNVQGMAQPDRSTPSPDFRGYMARPNFDVDAAPARPLDTEGKGPRGFMPRPGSRPGYKRGGRR